MGTLSHPPVSEVQSNTQRGVYRTQMKAQRNFGEIPNSLDSTDEIQFVRTPLL